MVKAEKGQAPLKEGHVWQQRRVKRGDRWSTERVQVPDPLLQLEKEKAMRKATPQCANPKGQGITLGRPDDSRLRQKKVDTLLEPLNRVAKEMEEKWGIDRLPGLVPIEMAERFASAAEKLDLAMATGDTERITERAEVMRRGWIKLDEIAEAAGHEAWQQPEVWEGRRPDGKTFLLVKDGSTAIKANRDTGQGVWTLAEIGKLLQHFDTDGFTQAMKEEFGGTLVSINAVEPALA